MSHRSADPVPAFPAFLRALESRNYRLFFSGQIVSLLGTWMTMTASLWLGYHLRSSAFLLGMVGFASQAPIFFLSPVAGVWVDRADKRRLLIGTQILSLLQSGALAALRSRAPSTSGRSSRSTSCRAPSTPST